ncbi:MAG: alpha-ketoacid dehydrogenase subunit beta [Chloroflexi bacterium]|nr:alpha-ketoacid dehydrogenase subunit beta [Chloroflexota bacterium]
MTTHDLTFAEAISEAIRLEMRQDPRVIVIGEDVSTPPLEAAVHPYGGLIEEFGHERLWDAPISEAGYAGAACGAAATGWRPIVDLGYLDHVVVCMDPVVNDAGRLRFLSGGQLKFPLVMVFGFGSGTHLGAHHSGAFYSVFTHFPGLKCIAPSDPYTAKGLTAAAIRDDDPVLMFTHWLLRRDLRRSPVPTEGYTWPLGKARVLRPGRDVTLIGISLTTKVCVEAAAELAKGGVEAEVVDLLSLSPMDEETILASVSKTKRLVIVDEDTPRCSMATDIAALVSERAFGALTAPVKRVTAPHTLVSNSPPMENAYPPTSPKVVAAVKALLESR